MTATLSDITGWLKIAQQEKATHLIVACDTYDHSNYPVYVTPDEDVKEEYEKIIGASMQTVDEVYDMSLSIESQLAEHRAFHM